MNVENGFSSKVIATHKGIDRGREPEFGRPELKIIALVLPIREHSVDSEANCRVELRGEGLMRRRELRLNVAQDLLSAPPA